MTTTPDLKPAEEGDWRSECGNGKYEYRPMVDCSCHISPPCSRCVNNPLKCSKCGHEPEE